jgi:hypothetical protein
MSRGPLVCFEKKQHINKEMMVSRVIAIDIDHMACHMAMLKGLCRQMSSSC